MKLIISDLDQTLVDVLWLHDQTTHKVIMRFFRKDAWLHEIDYAGRSQVENLRTLAFLKGIPESVFRAQEADLLMEFNIEFSAGIPVDSSQYILPGAWKLLAEISRKDLTLVLYTGNSPEVARTILQATGLSRFFRYCFFGTDYPSRVDMVRAAIVNLSEQKQHRFKGSEVVIIGDSIRDVECGKAVGSVTIAVTTGLHTRDQLEKASADLVVNSLEEYETIMKVINL